ncbi:MAG: P-loop NTPase [Spirochaetes bacterium]|nr:P-loop NTPase [Spirochaetota bacterium]MBU0954496.1 P-loop NTPase [Spirochaetota bacterium]
MATILPIASGKGGVGKTVFTANLGAALAGMGKTVIAVDLDLGGANLHTAMGVRNKHPGVGSIIWKKEKRLEDLVVPTEQDRLYLVPGDNLLPGTANLDFFTKKRIMKELHELTADFVLLDLGAGASYNIIDFWLMVGNGLLVTAPEIPAILNAYSFFKTAAFRLLFRSFKRGSEERDRIVDYVINRVEGQGKTFVEFAAEMAAQYGPSGEKALQELSALHPRVVVNMGNGGNDAAIAMRLREISARNLGISMDYIAYIMRDPLVSPSVSARQLILHSNPDCAFARGVSTAAERIRAAPEGQMPRLELDDEDLYTLMERVLNEEPEESDPDAVFMHSSDQGL